MNVHKSIPRRLYKMSGGLNLFFSMRQRRTDFLLSHHGDSFLWNSQRTVSGGTGRGDLYYTNPLNSNCRRRALGIQRGLVYNSQATQDQTGQLRFRKRVLHESAKGALGSMPVLRPAIASWSYLIPSLKASVEAAVPASIWEKLHENCLTGTSMEPSRFFGEAKDATRAANESFSDADRITLQEGQRWFQYELHQRLPLLEDSLMQAELKYLVMWPWLFRRVWVVLPPSSPTLLAEPAGLEIQVGEEPPTRGLNSDDSPERALSLPKQLEKTGLSIFRASRQVASVDMRPTTLQVYNLVDRVRVLTGHVEECVSAQLASLSSGCDEGTSSINDGRTLKKMSARSILKEAELRNRWKDNLAWHQEMRAFIP